MAIHDGELTDTGVFGRSIIARADSLSPTSVGALSGFLVGLVILGPALAPGFLLVYDMVFVPEPNFGARAFGLDGSVPRAAPTDLVVSLLSTFLPGWIVQKALLLAIFVVVGGGVGALVRSRPGAVVAAIAVCWNPYVAERLALGHWSFLLGYALVPWAAKSAADLLMAHRGATRRFAFWLTIAALCGSTAALLVGMTAVMVLCLPLAGRHVVARGARRRGLAVLMLVSVSANASWWLPALLIPGQLPADPHGVSAFSARADSPLGLIGSLLTGGGVWYEPLWPAERGSLLLTTVGLLLVLVCVARLIVCLHNSHPASLGLLGAGIAGVVVAAGGTVLADAVAAVVTQVPGGGLIRDGQKFLAPWVISVSCAIGGFGASAWTGRRMFRWRFSDSHPARRALLVAIGAVPVVVMPSLALGGFQNWNAAHYPENFLRAAAYVDRYDNAAVASFPWTLYRRYDWNHDSIVLDPWQRLVESRVIVNDDLPLSGVTVQGEDRVANQISAAVATGDSDRVRAVLRDAGVRFVLLHRDQPSSAQEGAFFDGESVVVEDRRIVLYDLGPTHSVVRSLPGWAWIGIASTGLTVLLVLLTQAPFMRNAGGTRSASV